MIETLLQDSIDTFLETDTKMTHMNKWVSSD